ncbi:hypothetical protein A2810_02705 [candidate division Kazan bacterium RIFCSPHIGHO2_01_FULL_49_10]|uniref:Uncharacterized protein n=1 Tax=candidate division Kazan bacterium RIFCSPLOWO2_01_FULL_48_13 TaxID=1798539 RepID=A0A1F4PPE5_UNCK3|nr:MAG: hypothetical protein A2810_02705 [candidate division Kazan bacterium RIFCSPHIGHO2_01_FULL_49_10]OGB85733.1 MAG: hypothetical protein A2994_03190 [candidate division Kazan bacterium RIFCSPLOWO2_01_FULL_48_13]
MTVFGRVFSALAATLLTRWQIMGVILLHYLNPSDIMQKQTKRIDFKIKSILNTLQTIEAYFKSFSLVSLYLKSVWFKS